MSHPVSSIWAAGVGAAATVLAPCAAAYIGPGSGLSAVGSLLALLAAVVVAIVGFLWYPLKRLIKGSGDEDAIEEDILENASQETVPGDIKEQ
ncbi:MAG: hypothetical protein CME59_00540 [Halioglobus sp.]|nr:hypothetical protein [Halioglobus sp.]|tara:strand:+ start:6083 stop:6361 length:279 start_codon:yes stop_codon:yes gene_type:complete